MNTVSGKSNRSF